MKQTLETLSYVPSGYELGEAFEPGVSKAEALKAAAIVRQTELMQAQRLEEQRAREAAAQAQAPDEPTEEELELQANVKMVLDTYRHLAAEHGELLLKTYAETATESNISLPWEVARILQYTIQERVAELERPGTEPDPHGDIDKRFYSTLLRALDVFCASRAPFTGVGVMAAVEHLRKTNALPVLPRFSPKITEQSAAINAKLRALGRPILHESPATTVARAEEGSTFEPVIDQEPEHIPQSHPLGVLPMGIPPMGESSDGSRLSPSQVRHSPLAGLPEQP
jgi:hypothetical protein